MKLSQRSGGRGERAIFERDSSEWLGAPLRTHLIELNEGRTLHEVNVHGLFHETGEELERVLGNISDDSLTALLLYSIHGENALQRRSDFRFVVDRAECLKSSFIQIWHGKRLPGEHEYEFGFSVYPEAKHVHFHLVSLGKGGASPYRGQGLMSETFQKSVLLIQRYYSGYSFSAVALSQIGRHWFDKYFQDSKKRVRSANEIIDLISLQDEYLSRLMVGFVPG